MPSERGFTLLEMLIATAIVAAALASVAQLVIMSATANRAGRSSTVATVLAAAKIEQLRTLLWSFDAGGLPVSDPGLAPSPSDSLRENRPGFCDFLDRNGRSLGGSTAPPPAAVYLRRWSIEPLPTDPDNVLVLQVLVTNRFNRGVHERARRLPGDARIITARARKAM